MDRYSQYTLENKKVQAYINKYAMEEKAVIATKEVTFENEIKSVDKLKKYIDKYGYELATVKFNIPIKYIDKIIKTDNIPLNSDGKISFYEECVGIALVPIEKENNLHEYAVENDREDLLKDWCFEDNLFTFGITPYTVSYKNNKIQAIWLCRKSGLKYGQKIANKVNGQSCTCDKCKEEKALLTRATKAGTLLDWCLTNGEYGKKILKEWSTQRNGDISKFPWKYTKEVWWKCEYGHEWKTAISIRTIDKQGKCVECNKLARHYKHLEEKGTLLDWCKQNGIFGQTFLKEWDAEKNKERGLELDKILPTSKEKAIFKCRQGHNFETSIFQRTKFMSGCPECRKLVMCKNGNSLKENNPDLALDWHPSLNGERNPSNVSKISAIEYFWRCQKCGYGNNGEWKESIKGRLLNVNCACPNCGYNYKTKEYSGKKWVDTKQEEILNNVREKDIAKMIKEHDKEVKLKKEENIKRQQEEFFAYIDSLLV